jgi:uncharacterized membrane protein
MTDSLELELTSDTSVDDFLCRRNSSINKKVKVLFLGSLILNVLVVGLIFGDLSYRFGRDRFWRPRMSQRLEQLPEPLREHLYKAMKQAREKTHPLLDKLTQTRRETIRILETEPFDAAAYDQQVSLLVDLRGRMARHMADVVKGLAKKSLTEGF